MNQVNKYYYMFINFKVDVLNQNGKIKSFLSKTYPIPQGFDTTYDSRIKVSQKIEGKKKKNL